MSERIEDIVPRAPADNPQPPSRRDELAERFLMALLPLRMSSLPINERCATGIARECYLLADALRSEAAKRDASK